MRADGGDFHLPATITGSELVINASNTGIEDVGSNLSLTNATIVAGKIGLLVFNQFDDEPAAATLRNFSIQVNQDGARGVIAELGGTANLAHGTIQTKGDNAYGLYSLGGSSITADDVRITTTGAGSYGVVANAMTNGLIGTIILSNSDIETSGDSSVGVVAVWGSRAALSNVSVVTRGSGSHGLYANRDGELEATKVTITTYGDTAQGVLLRGQSSLRLENSRIET